MPDIRSGRVSARVEPSTPAAVIRLPGAARSGLMMWSICVGPRELHGASVSSAWVAVPLARTAPTVIT